MNEAHGPGYGTRLTTLHPDGFADVEVRTDVFGWAEAARRAG